LPVEKIKPFGPDDYKVSDEALEAAMRAVRDLLRKKIDDKTLAFDDFEPFFRSLLQESDRALTVVAFSYIDEKLKEHMLGQFYQGISGGAASLFENFGPLSTASARIKVAAGLHWLSPPTYKNLEALRKIRNAFAHQPFLASIADNRIVSLLGSMTPMEKPVWEAVADKVPEYDKLSPRQLYLLRAAFTCSGMLREVTSAPDALRMGLAPSAAFQDGREVVPAAYDKLVRSSVIVMFEIAADILARRQVADILRKTSPPDDGAPNQRL